MKQPFIIAAIALTLSTSSFAGYRILGEEMYASPGSNAHIEHLGPNGAKHFFQKKSPIGSARSGTSVPSKSGRINQLITVDGYHHVSIYNDSKQRKTYALYFSLDCQSMHTNFRRYVEIDPGSTYNNDDHTYGTVQVAYAGSYHIAAETQVSGSDNNSSSDSNTLYVSK